MEWTTSGAAALRIRKPQKVALPAVGGHLIAKDERAEEHLALLARALGATVYTPTCWKTGGKEGKRIRYAAPPPSTVFLTPAVRLKHKLCVAALRMAAKAEGTAVRVAASPRELIADAARGNAIFAVTQSGEILPEVPLKGKVMGMSEFILNLGQQVSL